MSDAASERVTCPECGKGYRWDTKLIGRTVECRQCSTRFKVPAQPGERLAPTIADDGTYELDLDEGQRHPDQPEPLAVPANDGKCPACNSAISETAVICMNCGFNLKQGKRMQTQVVDEPTTPPGNAPGNSPGSSSATSAVVAGGAAGLQAVTSQESAKRIARRDAARSDDEADALARHRFIEFKLPIILLVVGFAIALINAFGLAPNYEFASDFFITSGGNSTAMGIAATDLIIFFAYITLLIFPLMMGGIFFMAAVYGSSFGNLFTAVLKLFAIAILVMAVDDLIIHVLNLITGGFALLGIFIRLAVVIPLFAILCHTLLDMEEHEIWTLFFIIIIGPAAIGLLVAFFFIGYF